MPAIAGFFLLPLLGGFFFLYFCNWTRFSFRKQEGHRLFFPAALWGGLFFSASHLTILLLRNVWGLPSLRGFVKTIADFPHSGAAIGAVLIGLTLPWVCNLTVNQDCESWPLRSNRPEALERVARLSNNFLHLLLRAREGKRQVLVTLENGKVYAAYVLWELEQELLYLKLLPLSSGYRTKELELEFTTFYEESLILVEQLHKETLPLAAAKELLKKAEWSQIVLKRDKVLSASFFDPDVYADHLEKRRKTSTSASP
jgi:hypothetical protein